MGVGATLLLVGVFVAFSLDDGSELAIECGLVDYLTASSILGANVIL